MDHIAEQAVVGAMLRDPTIVPDALSVVDVADFADPTGIDRRLFEAARALFREGAPIDVLTILGKLGLDGNKEARTYAAELMETTPTTANWREYATLMHESAMLRIVQENAMLLTGTLTLEDCRAPAAAIANALSAGRKVKPRKFSDLLNDFADRQSPDRPKKEFVSIGLTQVDRLLFLELGDVLVIGGLPSDGKTAFALISALHMAQKYKVGFFSLETNTDKMTDRLVTSGFQIDFDRIKAQSMTDLDWVQFAERMPEYCKRNLWLFNESRMTADQIAGISAAYDFDVIFIDYVQLISTEKVKGTTRAEQLADVSQSLKIFAQSTKTLVVELAQRKTPDRKDAQSDTDQFDLGESSQFGKDADVILQLSRPGKNDRVSDEDEGSRQMDFDKTRILKVAKNKEGKRGKAKLYFDGEHQSFYILGQEPQARRPRDRKRQTVGNPGQQSFETLPKSEEEGMPF